MYRYFKKSANNSCAGICEAKTLLWAYTLDKKGNAMLRLSFFVRTFVVLCFPVMGLAEHHSDIVSKAPTNSALEYPQQQWQTKSAEELGIAGERINQLFDLSFADSATQAAVLIKDGFLIGERYAQGFDQNSYGTSWSMAKSFYASLIGISIDRGEIASLDDKVAAYLGYFNDQRAEISIRDLLDMTSGLEMPDHEHEKMFFSSDHLAYARAVGVEKPAQEKFEYNNVNSMLLGDVLFQATGKKADVLFEERILQPLEINDYTLWKDEKVLPHGFSGPAGGSGVSRGGIGAGCGWAAQKTGRV